MVGYNIHIRHMNTRNKIIQFSQGRISDVTGCLQIIKKLPNYFTKKTHKEIKKCLDRKNFIIAKDVDSVIGFCCIEGKNQVVQEIAWLAVNPDSQREKVGTTLVRSALTRMKKTGAQYALVKTLDQTTHHDDYTQTRKFYERLGFTKIITIDPYPRWDLENPCAIYIKTIS